LQQNKPNRTLLPSGQLASTTLSPQDIIMKKALMIIGILFVVGTVVFVAVITIAGRDIPAPDVTDLAVDYPDIQPENNAHTYFMSATDVFHWPTNSAIVTNYLAGKSVDEDALAEIFEKNKEAVDLITRGGQCQRLVPPEVTSFDALPDYMRPWLNMGLVLAAKARKDRLEGRHTDAADTCIALLTFGYLVQDNAEAVLNYLIGMVILELGLNQAHDIARDPTTPSDELTRLSTSLATLGPLSPGLERALKVEYRIAANTIDQVRDGRTRINEVNNPGGGKQSTARKIWRIPSFFFQPNRTKLTLANLYRDTITNAPLYYAEMKRYDVEETLDLNASTSRQLTQPNAIGRLLYNLLVPAFNNILERKCRTKCDVAAAQLLVACNAYRNTEGRLPDDLQSLVPAYLKSVPIDPYDGEKFRYNLSEGIIYSVGKDLKDSGGSTNVADGDHETTPSTRRWMTEDVTYEIVNISRSATP